MRRVRLVDAGSVPAVRSQTVYHATARAMDRDTPDTIIVVSPSEPYVCVGFHQDLEQEVDLAYCAEHGLPVRVDETNPDTARGMIRDEILPLLRRLHPGAEANLRALGEERPRLPRALEASLVELLASRAGTKAADLGGGMRAVREYDTLRLEGSVDWGPWTLESEQAGLVVRTRRPGDRLAGRRKKVQDLLVDAKVPRAERDAWPVVVVDDEVVSVPGVAVAPGWDGVVRVRRRA